jgi:glycolate oxidase FAD binding subunit
MKPDRSQKTCQVLAFDISFKTDTLWFQSMSPDIQRLQETVRAGAHVSPRGACTKTTLQNGNVETLPMAGFSGVIDYQPSEFVITAWAGTPVKEIVQLLAERGQYLPFDPLLVQRGATLGGTVAANACGPERYRYGGVRDFLIGTRFIDGNGELLQGGGKVVKNAAGFDYPKLMAGSMGRMGIMVDVTFKVFPKPESYYTLLVPCAALHDALALLPKLTNSPFDLNAIEIVSKGNEYELQVRVGGLAGGLPARMDRARTLCGRGEVISGDAEAALWDEARELTWAGEHPVARVPITPSRMTELDAMLGNALRRYSAGGNVAWIATNDTPGIHATLKNMNLQGLTLLNAKAGDLRLGVWPTNSFAERVKHALDPFNKFG